MRHHATAVCLTLTSLCLFGCGAQSSDTPANSEAGGAAAGANAIESRLMGTFVSDKEASIAFLDSTGQYDADKLKTFGGVFGTTELTFQGSTRTTVMGDEVSKHTFEIVDSGPDYVIIESKWSKEEAAMLGADSETNRIEFTEDGFWLGSSSVPMDRFKEKYVRKDRMKSN